MAMPKSVVRISNKNGVTFIDNVDRTQYTLRELTRAALRDTGKFVCNRFRKNYYSVFKRKKRRVGRATQYWVRKRENNLQVGIKPNGFYGGFQELGSSKTKKLGLLQKSVKENIPMIVKIQSQYLSALRSESRAVALIHDKVYKGGADGE